MRSCLTAACRPSIRSPRATSVSSQDAGTKPQVETAKTKAQHANSLVGRHQQHKVTDRASRADKLRLRGPQQDVSKVFAIAHSLLATCCQLTRRRWMKVHTSGLMPAARICWYTSAAPRESAAAARSCTIAFQACTPGLKPAKQPLCQRWHQNQDRQLDRRERPASCAGTTKGTESASPWS